MAKRKRGSRKSGCLGLVVVIGAIWICGQCGANLPTRPTAMPMLSPTAPAAARATFTAVRVATATSEIRASVTPSGFLLSGVGSEMSQQEPRGTVTATVLNVRTGPGTSYAEIARLRQGESITLLAERGDWLQVRTAAGVIGWVAARYVTFGTSAGEAPAAATIAPEPAPAAAQEGRVVSIVDGDTIRVAIGEQEYPVRYIGMDTAEMGNAAGVRSKEQNAALVNGKTVRLEKDVSETDRYGRLLRYVWVGSVMINEELVRLGYAQAEAYPPDVKYQARLVAAQKEAVAAGRGLWGPEPATTAAKDANLRKGPGTNYPLAGSVQAGAALDIVARNSKGDWYQLASGAWIAGFLVRNAPPSVPVAAAIPTVAPKPTARPTTRPPAAVAPAQNCDPCYPGVCIPQVSYDLDCKNVPYCRFQVVCDPHGFDGDNDGVGCEVCR